MKDHFCPVEKEMIGFEGVCNWCGAEEKSTGWRKRQIALDIKAENARELGLDYEPVFTYDQVKAHIRAAMLSEREQCAKLCETLWDTPTNGMATEEQSYGDECAASIRARG